MFFHNLGFLIKSSRTLYWRRHLQFGKMEDGATERSSRFRPPKNSKEEVSLLERSKPNSTQYKDKWAVDVFRNWQAAHEKTFALVEPGSVFKDYDV